MRSRGAGEAGREEGRAGEDDRESCREAGVSLQYNLGNKKKYNVNYELMMEVAVLLSVVMVICNLGQALLQCRKKIIARKKTIKFL